MGWLFVCKLSGSGFESHCCHLSLAMTTEMDIFSNRLFNLNLSTCFLASYCFQLIITFKSVILEGAIKSCSTKIAVLKFHFSVLGFQIFDKYLWSSSFLVGLKFDILQLHQKTKSFIHIFYGFWHQFEEQLHGCF